MIRLRTLGTLDLRASGGEELRAVLAQPRRAALLAYLALATPRGTQRRDTLLALFWPELDTDRARNALGQAVHFLRRSISADAIVNRNGDGLAIEWSNFWCDAAAFEESLDGNRVGEALAHYRGDLLEGFHIDDAPAFERWLATERTRLATRYAKALESLATQREEASDFHGAVAHWQTLATRDPYSSRLTLRLMRALKAAGDPAGALLRAQHHEQLLRDELAIAPDAEVTALVRQIQSEGPKHTVFDAMPAVVPLPRARVSSAPQSATNKPPRAALPSRRRTALLAAGLIGVCIVGGAAVLKRGSNGAAIPAAASAQAPHTESGVPNDEYVRAMHARARNAEMSRSEIGLATARDAYERAIARDSSFAPAYAGLSELYGLLGLYGFMTVEPALDSSRMLANQAVALNENDSEARTALGVTLANAGEFAAAEREFRRAIDHRPDDAIAHYYYSMLLIALGRGEDAQREARRAAESGLSGWRGVQAAERHAHWLLTGERPHFKLPPKDRRPSLKLEPGDPWAIARQAEDLAEVGECTDARLDLERAERLAPDNVRMRPFMARVDWWCGQRPRARALLEDLKRRPDARDYAFDAALMHTFFGEKDSAFVWLGHNRWTMLELAILSAAPYLDPLRSDPRFLRMQQRIGVRK